MDKHLHIVAFDVPYPVDHGGFFDVFYKLVALYEVGVQVHLHCYEYGRGVQPELEKYCVEVQYYDRQQGHKGFSNTLPYIVASRADGRLTENLLKDNYPILLEGIHCTYLLHDERFSGRRILLRLHNVEHRYYRQLYRSCSSIFKKMYFLHESRLLRQYEEITSRKAFVVAVAGPDAEVYRRDFNVNSIDHIPVFTPFRTVTSRTGIGCFCLYHGNLSVSENEKAASWLLKNVFDDLPVHFIIAGKKPSKRLERKVARHSQCCIVADPTDDEMQDMIAKAQINILPSFNNTGIKLKLLNALYNGRHCIVNDAMVEGTGLEPACHIAGSAHAFKNIIAQLFHQPFTEEETRLRIKLLGHTFDNGHNARRLIQLIW